MGAHQDSSHPTGVSGTRGPALTNARQRKADAALAMCAGGANWAEIAVALGFPTPRAAKVAIEGSLAKRLDDTDRKVLREMAGVRLESLIRSVWIKAHDPDSPEHLPAVGRARDLIDRHIKLYGLDAPTEITITTPTTQQIDEWVARVVSSDVPKVIEADVVDAYVIEDDEAV